MNPEFEPWRFPSLVEALVRIGSSTSIFEDYDLVDWAMCSVDQDELLEICEGMQPVHTNCLRLAARSLWELLADPAPGIAGAHRAQVVLNARNFVRDSRL